jgi:TonB family protein
LRIQKIDPIYPGVAIQSKLQGTVVLDVRVNSSGGVDKVVHMSGPLTLAPAAIVAVKQWRYTPYVKDGQPIAVVSPVRLKFSLEENENGVVSEPEPSEDASPQKIALPRIAVPQRVRVSSGVSLGLLVKKVAPAYPPDARDAHIQGIVVLQANIDKEGDVSNLVLVSGDPMLAPAAIEAVQQWKYRPYLLNGQAVEVETTIQVNFVLTP